MKTTTARQLVEFTTAQIALHYGPGPHKDGSPQAVHAGGANPAAKPPPAAAGQMGFDFEAKPEIEVAAPVAAARRTITGVATGGRDRVVAGKKINTADVVNRIIRESNASQIDLSGAEQALQRLGHRQPPPDMIEDYAIQRDVLNRLGKATGSAAGGQIGKWDFSTAQTIHDAFNDYLGRRIAGQHARWTERKRGY